MNRSVLVLGSVVLSAFALAGCPTDPPRDSGGTDTGPRIDGGMSDTGGPIDAPSGTDTPGGGGCSVGAGGCDVLAQDCTDEGTTARGCYLSGGATVSTMCVPSGALAEGAACTNANDCQEGLQCQDGFCREYCCMGDTSTCPLGQTCVNYANPAGGVLPVGICSPPADCTVIPNSGCTAGNACVPGMDGTLGCFAAGTNAIGAACGDALGGCVPGAGCFGMTGGTFRCLEFCRIEGGTCTMAGTMCTAQPAVVGGGYGLCTPMPG